MVCSIQSRSQEPDLPSPVFSLKTGPDTSENTYLIVICFLQAFIEPWKPNDRLHEIPGDDPQVREPENAAGRGQEIHVERTAPKIWNHVDTQNRNYQFLKIKFTMWYNFFNGLQ